MRTLGEEQLFTTVWPQAQRLSSDERGRLAAKILCCGPLDEAAVRAFFASLGDDIDAFLEGMFDIDQGGI